MLDKVLKDTDYISKGARVLAYLPTLKLTPFTRPKTTPQKYKKMELYIEPSWAKKDTKFKKGHATWNKGRKDWTTTDPVKRRKMRRDLAKGRKHVWDKRAHIAYNGIPTSVYNLAGEYLGTFLSATIAAEKFGQTARNVRHCVSDKRKRCGEYMFRKAKIETFRGEKLVKKENIEPYSRKSKTLSL
mgnify:FL=1